ncbi:MAG: DUF2851 family protein [Muribaculaceae bacterium]|nr:DUF2851 family protein [Muribaculaceae bacterium]
MERLMQYVWQHRLLLQTDLTTVDGLPVSIIDPGRLNTDSGPDFFNAKIRIGDKLWAGDVEIHVRASDWHRHRHDGNPAYGSVVLHVVDRDDTMITRSNGEVIPQMVMQCAPGFHESYSSLVDRADIDLPCASHIPSMSPLHVADWIASLAYERAYAKAERLTETLHTLAGDWEQALYITLARALGFGKNSEPMERLARSLPLQFLRKHSDSLTAMEALFLGQAGFLDTAPADRYVEHMRREYAFLSHKFSLHAPQALGWKTGRMRPQNLPYRRVAMLAQTVADDFRMVRRLLDMESPAEAVEYFRRPLKGYWADRMTFGDEPSGRPAESMSKASASVMTINVAVPLFIAYGMAHNDDEYIEKGFGWLHELPAESNSVVSMFTQAGLTCRDAFTSQALIQLRRAYCECRRCLYCRLGHRLLAAKALRRP